MVGPLEDFEHVAIGQRVEIMGPHIRLAASINIGQFRRLSDFLNHRDGLLALRDAVVMRRNGEPTKVVTPSIWLNPNDLTLVAETENLAPASPFNPNASGDFGLAKVAVAMIFVTPGHTLTGNVFIPESAELDAFIESPDPSFVPMTDVRTRSLADRRVITRYQFALLNRRHIVAATPLLPGMAPGRSVL